jgi:hypothetical protein
MKSKTICIAMIIALAGAGQASAGGLLGLGILGNKTKTGSIVVAPSVDVGGILSDNDNNSVNVLNLNKVLNGSLNGILNGNKTGIFGGGKGKKHH